MANKLLLIKDVEDLGRSGEVVNVRPGFARNYLLPRGLAVMATPGALRMQKRLKEEREKQAIVDRQESEKMASLIEGATLSTIVKVDQEGHMYGSVTAQDVVELLLAHANVSLEKRAVGLKHPIKETGVHKLSVKLKEGITASLTLKVMSEEERIAAEAPPQPAAEA